MAAAIKSWLPLRDSPTLPTDLVVGVTAIAVAGRVLRAMAAVRAKAKSFFHFNFIEFLPFSGFEISFSGGGAQMAARTPPCLLSPLESYSLMIWAASTRRLVLKWKYSRCLISVMRTGRSWGSSASWIPFSRSSRTAPSSGTRNR